MQSRTLYIFVDESGNFDFSESGTKHLVMTALFCLTPVHSASILSELKYQLLSEGVGLANFHASEDRQQVRNLVFQKIASIAGLEAHTFWFTKELKQGNHVARDTVFASFGVALANLLRSSRLLDCDNAVVVFDKTLLYKEEVAFRAKCKPIFSRVGKPFNIYFHNVNRDFNGQIADYVAWANFVSLERNEHRPIQSIPSELKGATEIYLQQVNLKMQKPTK